MTESADALIIRPARWPQDGVALSDLDISLLAETIYRPILEGLSFRLIEECVDPPRCKTYDFRPEDPRERQDWDCALVAEADGRPVGFAAARYVAWNRRLEVLHLYVAPEYRRRGAGRRLLDALGTYARSVGARCLWLETQNVNVPAIRFYQRVGFHFCGFDADLYDPLTAPPDEIALFFARPVFGADDGAPQCA
jgi:ribosomal protein S18 acetylase RimI-like enzyme